MRERPAFVGIGSNIEPARHIPEALRALRSDFGPIACSPAYRSPPLGFEGEDFINCVVRLENSIETAALVAYLKALESRAGRRADATTPGSRELDLDLLLHGDCVIDGGGIRLPRPDVLEYAFVLRPLADLAPGLVHPQTGRTLAWHLRHFDGEPVALTPVALEAEDGAIQGKKMNGRGDRI